MITLNVINRYNQLNPDMDLKYNKKNDNEESDSEEISNIVIDHTHPQKLEEFFIKDDSSTWTVDQSTLDKVQKLIKDIELFSPICYEMSLEIACTQFKDEDGKVDKKATEKCKASLKDVESHTIRSLKDDVTLLYNIFSYTHSAYSLPDCKNKPLVKTISELAFATLKVYAEKSVDQVSDLIETFLNSSNILQLTDLLNTLKTLNVNNTHAGIVNEKNNNQ